MTQHRAWITKAFHDLKSAKKLIKGKDPIFDTAVYHTQQCAEKALKAFLAYHDRTIDKTHDIQLLLENCMEIDKKFKKIYDDGISLNPYSTGFRYPGLMHEPDIIEVKNAIKIAKKIIKVVSKKINTDDILA